MTWKCETPITNWFKIDNNTYIDILAYSLFEVFHESGAPMFKLDYWYIKATLKINKDYHKFGVFKTEEEAQNILNDIFFPEEEK